MAPYRMAACALGLLLAGGPAARAGEKAFSELTAAEAIKVYEEMKEAGWTPVTIKGKAAGKESVYDMTWRDDRVGGWYAFIGLTTKELTEKKAAFKKEGFKLLHESDWKVAGQERCAAVWGRVPDGRGYWAHKDGAYEHTRGHVWEEKAFGKEFKFVETGRTKEYVEIFDKGRGITVRMHADHTEAKGPGPKAAFKPAQTGKWGSK